MGVLTENQGTGLTSLVVRSASRWPDARVHGRSMMSVLGFFQQRPFVVHGPCRDRAP